MTDTDNPIRMRGIHLMPQTANGLHLKETAIVQQRATNELGELHIIEPWIDHQSDHVLGMRVYYYVLDPTTLERRPGETVSTVLATSVLEELRVVGGYLSTIGVGDAFTLRGIQFVCTKVFSYHHLHARRVDDALEFDIPLNTLVNGCHPPQRVLYTNRLVSEKDKIQRPERTPTGSAPSKPALPRFTLKPDQTCKVRTTVPGSIDSLFPGYVVSYVHDEYTFEKACGCAAGCGHERTADELRDALKLFFKTNGVLSPQPQQSNPFFNPTWGNPPADDDRLSASDPKFDRLLAYGKKDAETTLEAFRKANRDKAKNIHFIPPQLKQEADTYRLSFYDLERQKLAMEMADKLHEESGGKAQPSATPMSVMDGYRRDVMDLEDQRFLEHVEAIIAAHPAEPKTLDRAIRTTAKHQKFAEDYGVAVPDLETTPLEKGLTAPPPAGPAADWLKRVQEITRATDKPIGTPNIGAPRGLELKPSPPDSCATCGHPFNEYRKVAYQTLLVRLCGDCATVQIHGTYRSGTSGATLDERIKEAQPPEEPEVKGAWATPTWEEDYG